MKNKNLTNNVLMFLFWISLAGGLLWYSAAHKGWSRAILGPLAILGVWSLIQTFRRAWRKHK